MTPNSWIKLSTEHQINDNTVISALNGVYNAKTIYERLDQLILLHETCEKYRPENEHVTALQEQADNFIAVIGNSDDVDDVIRQRKDNRDTWPDFLPNTRLKGHKPFQTGTSRLQKINQRFREHSQKLANREYLDVNREDKVADEKLKVKMLTDEEKEAYRVMPANNILWQINQPDTSDTPLTMSPFDTKDHIAHSKYKGRAIFVLTPQGEMFAGSSVIGKFHHSSFQKGGMVAYGGTMEASNGQLTYVDDYSGHYQPGPSHILKMAQQFKVYQILNEDTVLNHKHADKGIAANDMILNTRQFLTGEPAEAKKGFKEPVKDHYQPLFESLMMDYIKEDDFTNPLLKSFTVVMRQYIEMNHQRGADYDVYEGHDNDLQEIEAMFEIDKNYAEEHPNEYEKHVDIISDLIEKDPKLSSELQGTEWLEDLRNPSSHTISLNQ